MIQVCSQCGTRWNVRDRQRSWCPRCGGGLLAPSATDQQWAPGHPALATPQQGPRQAPPRLAPGYRWIAVRPGAPPPARRQRGPLGPTPRYRTIPSWGLHQYFDDGEQKPDAERRGPGANTVRVMLIIAMLALGIAALTHVARYGLLLINRSVLLNPLIAGAGVLFGLLASLLALVVVAITVVLLIYWLVARRAEAYARRGQVDPRGPWELWICCLLPVVNLFMAPVFVLELASLEGRLSDLRKPIVVWWIVWVFSAIVATWSISSTILVTFIANTPQNIADNTVTTAIGYLFALAAIVLAARVFFGFEGTAATAERSVRRWVVVGSDAPTAHVEQQDERESAVQVEPEGQNPAA